jgi:hypothetical protein
MTSDLPAAAVTARSTAFGRARTFDDEARLPSVGGSPVSAFARAVFGLAVFARVAALPVAARGALAARRAGSSPAAVSAGSGPGLGLRLVVVVEARAGVFFIVNG